MSNDKLEQSRNIDQVSEAWDEHHKALERSADYLRYDLDSAGVRSSVTQRSCDESDPFEARHCELERSKDYIAFDLMNAEKGAGRSNRGIDRADKPQEGQVIGTRSQGSIRQQTV